MKQPTLYMMVGLPGSGKTTRAKEIEKDQSAIRFSPDEWVAELYEHRMDGEHHEHARAQVEKVQWDLGKRLLALGQDVILENGFWSRTERQRYIGEAKAIGALVKINYEEVPVDELWRRSEKRPETRDVGMLHFTKDDLEGWAASFEPPTQDEIT